MNRNLFLGLIMISMLCGSQLQAGAIRFFVGLAALGAGACSVYDFTYCNGQYTKATLEKVRGRVDRYVAHARKEIVQLLQKEFALEQMHAMVEASAREIEELKQNQEGLQEKITRMQNQQALLQALVMANQRNQQEERKYN
jgi:hypothetical protein